jgi:hypothetical protein
LPPGLRHVAQQRQVCSTSLPNRVPRQQMVVMPKSLDQIPGLIYSHVAERTLLSFQIL